MDATFRGSIRQCGRGPARAVISTAAKEERGLTSRDRCQTIIFPISYAHAASDEVQWPKELSRGIAVLFSERKGGHALSSRAAEIGRDRIRAGDVGARSGRDRDARALRRAPCDVAFDRCMYTERGEAHKQKSAREG